MKSAESKNFIKEMDTITKTMLALSLFLELMRYLAIAAFAGLLAFAITAMVATIPVALVVFAAVVATITCAALIKTATTAVAGNKAINFATRIFDVAVVDKLDVAAEKPAAKKVTVATQTSHMASATCGRGRLFDSTRVERKSDSVEQRKKLVM